MAYYIYAFSKRDSKKYDFNPHLLAINCDPKEIIRVTDEEDEETLWFYAHMLEARGMTFMTEEKRTKKGQGYGI